MIRLVVDANEKRKKTEKIDVKKKNNKKWKKKWKKKKKSSAKKNAQITAKKITGKYKSMKKTKHIW